ncbi:MAG: hypothetical protein IT428_32545 [Planctomycetaceae bacterium]|nr:hypothetical protein [Planctomycetaceae bacterium]
MPRSLACGASSFARPSRVALNRLPRHVARGFRRATLAAAISLVACVSSAFSQAPSAAAPQGATQQPDPRPQPKEPQPLQPFIGEVDFLRDVQPIFQKRCVECHSAELPHGGLRLDDRDAAARGGHTRRAILGGRPELNELLRRVRSDDVGVRMPKNTTPLTSREVSVLQAWVEQGSPWATEVEPAEVARRVAEVKKSDPGYSVWIDRYDVFARAITPYIPWLLIVSLSIGLIERYQQVTVQRRAKALDQGIEPRPRRFEGLMRVTRSHYLNVVLLLALGIALHRLWVVAPAEARKAEAARTSGMPLPPKPMSVTSNVDIKRFDQRYGTPPRPLRPQHPRQLAGTYYRGNCERSPELYNGGSYQTARFHIRLCDTDGNTVSAGDAVPRAGLFVQIDMERPHGTHPSFYNADTIRAVALSTQVFASGSPQPPSDPLVRLTEVKPEWSWTMRYPLGRPEPDHPDAINKTIYFYRGTPQSGVDKDGKFSGEFHYAIIAELQISEGKLSDKSDLWMGSLFVVPTLEFPTAGKVPLSEWFDYRPLPEIPGENTTTDPKLLGLPTKAEPPAADPPRK